MESVYVVVYCEGDMISSSEGILFECPSGPKVITISEDMSLDSLRKTIMDAIGGCRILLDLFYRQLVYVGDGCVEYKYIELKHDNGEGKMFIYLFES